MNRKAGMSAGQVIGTVDGQQVFGLDIAKSVFQVHTVDMGSGEIVNQQLKRAKVLTYFANRTPCLIGIEACGGAHHWARRLTAQGHNVRLIHAKAVRPFVGGNKTDAADARAIWLAIQQPGTKFVGMKTLEQQATLVLHRQRELLMKMKAMQSNALRGLLYEFGATFARGKNALFAEIETALEPFRQIATARRAGGTGLGLPLTKALIEANRASLTIRSAKDAGTLVEVTFPQTRVLAE
jgi:transposase